MPTCETTIRRGLSIAVAYAIFPSEPDIGIFSPQVEISEIRVWDERKQSYRPASWLEKSLTREEWEQLEEKVIAEQNYGKSEKEYA